VNPEPGDLCLCREGRGFSWWADYSWLMVEPEHQRGERGPIMALFLRSDGELIEAPASFFEVASG